MPPRSNPQPGNRSPNLKNFGDPETPKNKITSHSLWDEGEEPEFWTDGAIAGGLVTATLAQTG